ncbi:MAG: hypothetical protein WC489_02080 [Patescibacteria group bacterium]
MAKETHLLYSEKDAQDHRSGGSLHRPHTLMPLEDGRYHEGVSIFPGKQPRVLDTWIHTDVNNFSIGDDRLHAVLASVCATCPMWAQCMPVLRTTFWKGDQIKGDKAGTDGCVLKDVFIKDETFRFDRSELHPTSKQNLHYS